MLSEEEFGQVTSLRRSDEGVPDLRESFGPVLEEYERITGFKETNLNAIYHHRLSLYGPPCEFCLGNHPKAAIDNHFKTGHREAA